MSKLVTFKEDVYPYVRGDVVKLDADQLKAVDEAAARRGIETAYVAGDKGDEAVAAGVAEQVPEAVKATSNPFLPEYPQVDGNGEPVLEQQTRAEADAKVVIDKEEVAAKADKKVKKAKAEPAVVNDTKESDLVPGTEEPADNK